jgi:hypothetical protein
MAAKDPVKLIHSWTWGKSDYRLLETTGFGGYSYKPQHILEVDEKDSLGAPKWVCVHTWMSERGERDVVTALSALVAAVKAGIR